MTGFKDIVGMDEIKKTIRDDLILMKIRGRGDSKGIILTGVSGAGKSFIADKLQEEMDMIYPGCFNVIKIGDQLDCQPHEMTAAVNRLIRWFKNEKNRDKIHILVLDKCENFFTNRRDRGAGQTLTSRNRTAALLRGLTGVDSPRNLYMAVFEQPPEKVKQKL